MRSHRGHLHVLRLIPQDVLCGNRCLQYAVQVPSTKRGVQVKEKVKKKAMTPWSAEAEAAAKKKDKSKAPDPPSGIRVPPVPVWAPSIPTAKSLSGAPLQQVRVRFALYSSDSDWLT